ncbi:MAG: metal ABC transporter ATP-binding protein [Oscillospiraceae bacterium]
MDEILKVEGLAFTYQKEPVFSNVSFGVNKGDFTALIGTNGAGKSTLLKVLLGDLEPQQGSIHWFTQSLQHFKKWPMVGYVPQNGLAGGSSFPATVKEIVQANLYSQMKPFQFYNKKTKEQTMAALKMVGMQDYSKSIIGNLSGGQQQRVLLARALVASPEVMVLDEPTTGVDAKASDSFCQLLSHLNKQHQITILMVTHDLHGAAQYVKDILCLEEGSLIALSKEQLQDELHHRHTHPGHVPTANKE